jgi:hypothetical protein
LIQWLFNCAYDRPVDAGVVLADARRPGQNIFRWSARRRSPGRHALQGLQTAAGGPQCRCWRAKSQDVLAISFSQPAELFEKIPDRDVFIASGKGAGK